MWILTVPSSCISYPAAIGVPPVILALFPVFFTELAVETIDTFDWSKLERIEGSSNMILDKAFVFEPVLGLEMRILLIFLVTTLTPSSSLESTNCAYLLLLPRKRFFLTLTETSPQALKAKAVSPALVILDSFKNKLFVGLSTKILEYTPP